MPNLKLRHLSLRRVVDPERLSTDHGGLSMTAFVSCSGEFEDLEESWGPRYDAQQPWSLPVQSRSREALMVVRWTRRNQVLTFRSIQGPEITLKFGLEKGGALLLPTVSCCAVTASESTQLARGWRLAGCVWANQPRLRASRSSPFYLAPHPTPLHSQARPARPAPRKHTSATILISATTKGSIIAPSSPKHHPPPGPSEHPGIGVFVEHAITVDLNYTQPGTSPS